MSTDDTAGAAEVLSEDGHLGWRLSALLDGELPVAEEMVAREHLADCDRCQEEFVEVTTARELVRGLGAVEPPQGYLDRVLTRVQRRSRQRLGLMALLVLTVAWVLVLLIGAGARAPVADPDLAAFVERHRSVEVGEPPRRGTPVDPETLDAPFALPDRLSPDLELVGAASLPRRTAMGWYEGPGGVVSVFQQEGSTEGDPPVRGAQPLGSGAPRWTVPADAVAAAVQAAGESPGGESAVIVELDTMVVTVVGAAAVEELVALADQMPEPRPFGLGDQLRRALEGFGRRLGLDERPVPEERGAPEGQPRGRSDP